METQPLQFRTIFMGTSEFSSVILERLIKEKYNLISVFTQPDKKSGRKMELAKSNVKQVAEKNNLTVFQPEKLSEEIAEEIKRQSPDLIIIVAYGKIIPKKILEIPTFGIINVHPSLLPCFRGPSPIQNALLSGKKETGTTIMLMNEKIDSGDILSQEKITIEKDESQEELSKKLSLISSDLLIKTIPLWIEKKIIPQKQDEKNATFCQLIEKSDGKIIWSQKAEEIYNQYRALSPWPGIFSYWEKDGAIRRLKILSLRLEENETQNKKHIGEVFMNNTDVLVKTGKGFIILEEVQLEGKNKTKIKEFLNGYPDFLGSILK